MLSKKEKNQIIRKIDSFKINRKDKEMLADLIDWLKDL